MRTPNLTRAYGEEKAIWVASLISSGSFFSAYPFERAAFHSTTVRKSSLVMKPCSLALSAVICTIPSLRALYLGWAKYLLAHFSSFSRLKLKDEVWRGEPVHFIRALVLFSMNSRPRATIATGVKRNYHSIALHCDLSERPAMARAADQMTQIYITHCSAKKDDRCRETRETVTPDLLYTAKPTQRFMERCKATGVRWAIFSDLYGVWFPEVGQVVRERSGYREGGRVFGAAPRF